MGVSPAWAAGAEFTKHACQRFAERFPRVSIQEEWQAARLISKSERRVIVRWRRQRGRIPLPPGERLYKGPSGSVFVVALPCVVITVLKWSVITDGR